MSNKNVFSYDFEKMDNNLLSHISMLYLNDVIAFISLTNVIAYNGIIVDSISMANNLPKQLNSMLFTLNSAVAILNNLHTADFIKDSQAIVENDTLPELALHPLLSNLICNYKIIPYINKTKYFQYLQQRAYPLSDIDKIIYIIYDSCHQFAGEN